MLNVIHCKNCNKSSSGLNSIKVNVNLTRSYECCGSCHNRKDVEINHYFCSYECFIEHMKLIIVNNDRKQLELTSNTWYDLKKNSLNEMYVNPPTPVRSDFNASNHLINSGTVVVALTGSVPIDVV
jgi:hypothetical protein